MTTAPAPRALFVCVENACRSQLAEALARQYGLQAQSAGSRPAGRVNAKALAALAELGLPVDPHASKDVAGFSGQRFDAAVTMGCGDACPMVEARVRHDWELPDPKALPAAGFRAAREEIARRVVALARALRAELPALPVTTEARVREHARRTPDAVALTWDGRALTYRALDEAADAAAARLLAAGAAPGSRVALRLRKGPGWIAVHLGVLRLGAVLVPLNERAPPSESARIVADAGARLLVGDAGHADEAQEVVALAGAAAREPAPSGAPALLLADPDALAGALAAPPADDVWLPAPPPVEALACLVYTSGTTGAPKGVPLTHAALAANADALAQVWRLSADDVLLHVLPLFHIHGLFVALHGALRAGARTVLHERLQPDDAWRALRGDGVSVLMAVPTVHQRLLEHAPADTRLPRLRLALSGSAPLAADVAAAFERATGCPLLQRYGLTETGIVTSERPGQPRSPGSVGEPLPGVTVTIVDRETGVALPPGEDGEVLVHGASVTAGYWRGGAGSAAPADAPARTGAPGDGTARDAPFTRDGGFRTGDVGRLDERGALHLVGRSKELIITGGFNVAPAEVEAVLLRHPGVAEAAAVGLPDGDLGEVVAAAVVPRAGGPPPDGDALLAHCRRELAAYKCPRRLAFVAELPRNAMGKLLRAEVARALAEER